MGSDVPDYAAKTRKAFESLICVNRNAIRDMLRAETGTVIFKNDVVKTLHQHAVVAPDASCLAKLLVDTTPGMFVAAEALALKVNSAADTKETNLSQAGKLREAVVEAALAEQLHADQPFCNGRAFSAAKLEESLDNWLYGGRHRAGQLDESPLSQISKIMERQGMTGEELMATRFGILIPVIVAIHIWRVLEEYPQNQARLAGWGDFPNADPDKAPNQNDAATAF